ncbi:hypothetical protein Patl1_00133 [Pistacia atlantica]|uniref:Uncharacterized protein n=1 Tax=Pistacia atlantica TaxID=434234 RepID=A0ACC1C483_9ROSI|nr:hypothetical protein Patl1_00133 [Pistacia atlantica]
MFLSPTDRNSNSTVEVQTTNNKSMETASKVEGDKEEARKESVASADKQKRRFSISLSREEIEADILATGGSKRLRRSKKKRAKYVQRILDNLFPGLRLKSITIEDYRVSDSP